MLIVMAVEAPEGVDMAEVQEGVATVEVVEAAVDMVSSQ